MQILEDLAKVHLQISLGMDVLVNPVPSQRLPIRFYVKKDIRLEAEKYILVKETIGLVCSKAKKMSFVTVCISNTFF